MMNYLDFEIKIQEDDEGFTVSARSPMGEAKEPLVIPFSQLELESRLQTLQIALLRSGSRRRRIRPPEFQAVQDFGQALFHMIFSGQIYSLYYESQREAAGQGRGLRLRLNIDSPDLATLPWEILYDSREGEYVCLSRNTPLVRYLDVGHPPQELVVTPPLRILGMIANPSGPSGLPPLDEAVEKERVERALSDLRRRGIVTLTWLEGQTWQDLQRTMRGGPWHIFHFIGHGGFDETRDEGLIMLTDDEGKPYPLTATQLGRLLDDHRSLRLVVLNTCESARSGNLDVFASTAATLIRRGLPAVLAMQYEITDQGAIQFSQAFYEALADGMSVDSAVSEARKAISLATADSVEWATPVLYLRAPTGRIFDVDRTAAPLPSREPQPAGTLAPQEASAPGPETNAEEQAAPWRHWPSAAQILLALLVLVVTTGIGYVIYRNLDVSGDIVMQEPDSTDLADPVDPTLLPGEQRAGDQGSGGDEESNPSSPTPDDLVGEVPAVLAENAQMATQQATKATATARVEEGYATATAQLQATLRAQPAATAEVEAVPTPLRPADVVESGEGVTVALLGTGIDNTHPDLSARILVERDFTGTGTGDVVGHDTVVAGIIAGSGQASGGRFVGVAPDARLYFAKVLNEKGIGSSSNLLSGLKWLIDQQPDVLLIALEGGGNCDESDRLSLEIAAAVDAGIVVVSGAGNRGDEGIPWPGCVESVITVGSTNATGAVSSFSGRGPTAAGVPKPDVVAPGERLVGPLAARSDASPSRWDAAYTEMSGASVAAAYVAGVVALMLEANPDLTLEQVKSLLRQTVRDLGEDENAQGAGLVDPRAAVAAAITANWDDAEKAFYRAAANFAAHLGLPVLMPQEVVFDPSLDPQTTAYWIPEPPHYRVSPERLDLPGLPQYIALSGWFLSIQPDSCPGGVDIAFQNEFRWSLTSYLISTDPTIEGVADTNVPSLDFEEARTRYDLAQRLQAVEEGVGAPEPVRQLALSMLREFDCDWKAETLYENIVTLNQRQNLVPAAVIEAAFRD